MKTISTNCRRKVHGATMALLLAFAGTAMLGLDAPPAAAAAGAGGGGAASGGGSNTGDSGGGTEIATDASIWQNPTAAPIPLRCTRGNCRPAQAPIRHYRSTRDQCHGRVVVLYTSSGTRLRVRCGLPPADSQSSATPEVNGG